eukprot:GFUD01028941.1.p1 GENE.GFUD01028941.1~~GFUD01028941.1.p1  ORF type:complete len:940 (+),score=309.80 GFUD01028941.1:99-2918(+)
MFTPRIRNCYLPVLQSAEALVGFSDQNMINSSTIVRGRDLATKMLNVENSEHKVAVSDVDSNRTKYVENEEGLLGDKRKNIIRDIDIITKLVTRKEVEIITLKKSNAKLEKRNAEHRSISEELLTKYQDELQKKLEVIKDNQKLVYKIQALAKGDLAGDDKKYEMLVATIKDKDGKLLKLTELIIPLRKKVKEQESLRAELTLANGEKKGLMEVNEEIVREIASLNDRHLQAMAVKDKQLAQLQDKSSKLMEETRRILEAEKSETSGQTSEMRKVEELKRSLGAEQRALQDTKKAFAEEWKKINDQKKLVDEENAVIEDEKRVIDEEWGDIVRKKQEIADTEKAFSGKVKDLVKENDDAKKEKYLLETKLRKAKEELHKTKSHSNLAEHLQNSQKTVDDILKNNEVFIATLQTENIQVISELKEKESQIEAMKNDLEKQEDLISSSEEKLNDEIRSKEGVIRELEHKVSQQEEKIIQQQEQHSGVVLRNQVEIGKLKSRIGVLNNNNKRRLSESEDESFPNGSSKKLKQSEEVTEPNTVEKLIVNEEVDTLLVNENSNEIEEHIDEVVPVVADEEIQGQLQLGTNFVNAAGQMDQQQNSSLETDELRPIEIETVDNTDSVKPVEIRDSSDQSDSATDSSALKLIAAMNDFESLIRTSRGQDTQVQEISHELDRASELSVKQVEDVTGQTKIINIINTANKSKSIRDVFDDSDDETEEEVINETSEPATVSDEVTNTTYEQPTIKIRDITTICESKADVDGDIIIPINSGDIMIDISEEDEAAKRVAQEDVNKLRTKVADVVQISLSKFFKIVDGIQTEEDLASLNTSFSKQFTEEIMSSHLETHPSLEGISMTKHHKRGLVDQIIFYFEIKKSVNLNLRTHLHPSSPQFVTFTSTLSNQFSKDIMESHRMMFNSLTGLALTPDNHQWIGNQIKFKMNQK